MKSGRDLKAVVSRVGELPAMPKIVAEVLELTEDPDAAVSEVSKTIERDPALTAKFLKVSNSAYYGMRQVVGTLKLALVVLGAQEVRNLVLGIAVLESLHREDREWPLRQQDFWDHSFTVGALSKKLGTHLELRLQGEDFISGLLHDIGKLVLWRQLEGEYETVCRSSGETAEALCAAEIEAFGFDHADAGSALAKRWNMPETLSDALWHHHPREGHGLDGAKDPKLAALVRVANLTALDDWSTEESGPKRSCADEECWEILLDGKRPLDTEARRELLAGFVKALDDVPALAF